MRLIDADRIKVVGYGGLIRILPNDYVGIANYFYEQLIKNQPTAYDVDKIVEQLKKKTFERHGNKGMGGELVINFDDVIEIIKRGGKDE